MQTMNQTANNTIIALDVGDQRIGIARASVRARLPSPLTTLAHDPTIFDTINEVISEEQAVAVVVGLPRGMDGQETDQTKTVRLFSEQLKKHIKIPVYLQDEALTSKKAEQELATRKGQYDKAMIDALAATYILEDYLLGEVTSRKGAL